MIGCPNCGSENVVLVSSFRFDCLTCGESFGPEAVKPPIDLSAIRVGDEVTVQARVKAVSGDGIWISKDTPIDTIFFHPEFIISHTPAPVPAPVVFERGDVVRWGEAHHLFRVRAVDGDGVWIDCDTHRQGFGVLKSELTLVYKARPS